MSTGADMLGDRLKRAISAFVRELFPDYDFTKQYTYIVASFNVLTQTADLQPAPGIGTLMPTLTEIPIRTPGVNYILPSGMAVLVGFANGDQTKPYIVSLDAFAGSGFVPTFTGLAGATPIDVPPIGGPVARLGDRVGPFVITSGSLKVFSR